MISPLLAAGLDGALYFGTAVVLSLTSREFGLYNLAGGAWLVLGGWLAALMLAGGHPLPLNSSLLPVFLFLLLFQAASPVLLGNRLRKNPLSYLFVSLGVALVVIHVGGTYLLSSSGSSVPVDQSTWSVVAFLTFGGLSICAVFFLFQSPWWSRLVIRFRSSDTQGTLTRSLSALVFVELAGLLILGGSTYYVHKGIFGAAEYRTIIPILALVATKGRPIRAGLLSFVVVVLSHGVVALGPIIFDVSVAQYAKVIAILSLLLAVLFRSWPDDARNFAQMLPTIPPRLGSWLIWQDDYYRGHLFGLVAFLGAAGLLAVVTYSVPTSWSSDDLTFALWIVGLSVICAMAQRFLGIQTIAWPAVGLLPIYCFVLAQESVFWLVILLGAFFMLWTFYGWSLRVLKHEPALVVDLAFVTCIHQVVKSSTVLSGTNEVIIFSPPFLDAVETAHVSGFLVGTVVFLMIASAAMGRHPWLRAGVLGLANFQLGRFHGLHVKVLFFAAIATLSVLVSSATAARYLVSETVTSRFLSVEWGLSILLLGHLLQKAKLVLGLPFILGVFGLFGGLLASRGTLVGISVGVAFIIGVFLLQD